MYKQRYTRATISETSGKRQSQDQAESRRCATAKYQGQINKQKPRINKVKTRAFKQDLTKLDKARGASVNC